MDKSLNRMNNRHNNLLVLVLTLFYNFYTRKKIGNFHGLARTYDNLSELYNSQGKEDLAMDYNLKAVTILGKIARDGSEMNSEIWLQSGVW